MKQSAGILLYKRINKEIFVLLVHPGGPFWKNKDAESWSIPKGEFTEEETAFEAALREFEEETGFKLTEKNFIELNKVKMKSGKIIYAWACEKDFDVSSIKSNTFEMEWPPKSGLMKLFPEIDKAAWFKVGDAMHKIIPAQSNFIDELVSKIKL